MCSRVLWNQKIATIIAMMKEMLAKTKKDFTESKLLDQALKLLFMMSMKGSLSQKNMFMLPAGPSVKKYIDETTSLFNLWVSNTTWINSSKNHPSDASFITSKTEEIFKIERASRSTKMTIVTLEGRRNWSTTIWSSDDYWGRGNF